MASANDEDRWLELLRGAETANPDSSDDREAASVRRALLNIEAREQAANRDESSGQLERLLFRLRRERLSTAKLPRFALPLALAAAVTLAYVALPLMYEPGDIYDPPPVLRGGVEEQVIKVPDPRRQAEALRDRIVALGVASAVYQAGSAFVVDIEVPSHRIPELVAASGLPNLALRAGYNRVRFIPR